MSDDRLSRLKTGAFERRFSIAKASVVAGSRLAASAAGSIFSAPEDRASTRRRALGEQAEYLVREMGKLKGSVVKIGQMMALYGEHFLPPEITSALHKLNDSTTALHWHTLEPIVRAELGARFDDLEINPEPLGAASLAQVHRARRRSDGKELVLKIQYPGVADAIDSDLALVTHMLKLTRAVPQTRDFDEWLDEVRHMMHREVNYPLEAETTRHFRDYLKDDPRFVVPQIFSEYCTERLLVMSYESGVPVNSAEVLALSPQRRNAIAIAALEICCKEVFLWGQIQTDPNFGNYLLRLGDGGDTPDRIILLDFGAVRDFPDDLLSLARGLTKAAFNSDRDAMLEAMKGFRFFDGLQASTRESFIELAFLAFEPFSDLSQVPREVLNADGDYCWARSRLHVRATSLAARSAASKQFSVPPKEFMFLSRKFMGAYTFMTVMDAQIRARDLLARYL
ncbi:MAG: AarF/ABC1/UbiB kinase family protein [Moraxellaceae bacterium]|nr:AarF/ABC1/UbiB kinase family protein [Moraxellaceae bacterium]MDZ4385844.1 AarF/ABC1/UbiB kinase family protein [Moraxellaceae bacterium]